MGNRFDNGRGLCSGDNEPDESVNWTLKKAFKVFREGRQAESRSQNTLIHYDKSWALFTTFAVANGIEFVRDVESYHLTSFFSAMDCLEGSPLHNNRGGGYSKTTKNKTGIDLKTIFGWLAKQKEKKTKILDENPFDDVKVPANPKLVLPPFNDDELSRMHKACEGSTPLRIRDRALFLFLLDSAVRHEEAQKVRICDIDLEKRSVVVLEGKGGATRTSRISQITARAISKYLDLDRMAAVDSTAPLWWGKLGPLTYDGLGEVIEAIGERAGVKGGCHALRRTAAIRMLRSGASLEDVRRLLGHADFQSILKYLAYVDEDLKNAHDKHSPVASLECTKPKPKGLGRKRRKKAGP